MLEKRTIQICTKVETVQDVEQRLQIADDPSALELPSGSGGRETLLVRPGAYQEDK